jgi:hypothetical protein
MPPRNKKKQDTVFSKVAEFLAAQGMQMPDVDTATDRDYRSNDAVVIFAHHPAGFKPGICKECGKPYATNRKSVGFCSDPCRRDNWKKTTGLEWRAISTHDVWEGDPPLIISPEQFEKMRQIAAWFNTNRTVLDTLVEKPLVEAPELEFLAPGEENPMDSLSQTDPEIEAEKFLTQIGWFEESLTDDIPESLPTSPHSEPSLSALELTEEEVYLFES